MNATAAVRSGAATGVFAFASRKENRNRLGPTTCCELTISGMTDAGGCEPEAGPDAAGAGDALGTGDHAEVSTTRAARTETRGRRGRMPRA
jgi:hypothetical protein